MRGAVYIDGVVVSPEDARISVFDRGFLYGDSVYETLRVYGGRPFAFAEHVERLFASGMRIGFALPWDTNLIRAAVDRTLEVAELPDAYMRIVATRGSGVLGLDPALAVDPQLIVMVLELPALPASLYEQGRSVWLVSVQRNLKRALDPQAKTGNYMNSVLALREARENGADEALMLDHLGRVAEASAANVFALIDGVWTTPPTDVGILMGITRKHVLQLCRDENRPVEERVLWPRDLFAADEIFLCSTVRELVPVVSLDGRPVGTGEVGEGFRQMHALYRRYVSAQAHIGLR